MIAAWLSGLRPALLVGDVQLLEVLVQAVCEKDLASALPGLHLHDHLAAGHFDLLLFHALASLFHLLYFLRVAILLSLTLLPLFISNTRHDLHRFLRLFLLIFELAFVMILHLLLTGLSLLLDKTVLQPVFERTVALLLLNLLMQSLGLLLS